MTKASVETRIVVKRNKATLAIIARAALEMTVDCFVWLEKVGPDTAVTLTLRRPPPPGALPLRERFQDTLNWLICVERHEKRTRGLRSAILGHALATRHRARALPTSPLDPETEAEIERLLAEIESDDWLEDETEIAKTWEERFGVPLASKTREREES